jgi:hypothetical protein
MCKYLIDIKFKVQASALIAVLRLTLQYILYATLFTTRKLIALAFC